ncbi:MAG: zinc-ribbon domain-containing protein [Nitrospinota bacterium]
MIVKCDQCATRYKVPEEKVSMAGTKAKCKGCGQIMTLYPPAIEKPVEPPQASAPAAEVSVAPDPHASEVQPASKKKARSAPLVTWRSLLFVGVVAVLVGVGVSYVLGQAVNRSLATFISTILK